MFRELSSLAMRTDASWFSNKRKPSCCWVISMSRLTDSLSRSISSFRKYQNAEMMAAKNSNTEIKGANVANRSCRAGDCFRHQRPNNLRASGSCALGLDLRARANSMG